MPRVQRRRRPSRRAIEAGAMAELPPMPAVDLPAPEPPAQAPAVQFVAAPPPPAPPAVNAPAQAPAPANPLHMLPQPAAAPANQVNPQAQVPGPQAPPMNPQAGQPAPLPGNVPVAIPSLNAPIGLHVPVATKEKIILGQYVDLAQLLDVQPGLGPEARRFELSPTGELVARAMPPSRSISTIEKWSDAFLVYMSIFLTGHPHRTQELLKYMNVIRKAASRHQGLGWRTYDQQFRLRLAADPVGVSFASLDNELWLLYVGAPANEASPSFLSTRK